MLATCRVSRVTCPVPGVRRARLHHVRVLRPGAEALQAGLRDRRQLRRGRRVRVPQLRGRCGLSSRVSRVTCHVSRSGGERDREHHHQHRVLLRLYRLRQPHRLRGGRGGRVPPGGAAGHQQQQHPALVTCQGEYGTECTSLGLDNLEMVDYDNGKEAFFDGTPDDDGDDDGKGNMQ